MQLYSLLWQFDANVLWICWLLNFHIVSRHRITVRISVLRKFSTVILAAYIILAYNLGIIHKTCSVLPDWEKKCLVQTSESGEAKIICGLFFFLFFCLVLSVQTGYLTSTGSHGPLLIYVEGACIEQFWELGCIPKRTSMNLGAYFIASDLFLVVTLLTHSSKMWSVKYEVGTWTFPFQNVQAQGEIKVICFSLSVFMSLLAMHTEPCQQGY